MTHGAAPCTSSYPLAGGRRASQIAGDLLDFTRSHLGPGIPLNRKAIDVQPICANIVEEARTIHTDAVIRYSASGQVNGFFDGDRLEQVFSNLITNAIKHGSGNDPVDVALWIDEDALHFRVHNSGDVIPADLIPHIFNPMARFSEKGTNEYGPQAGVGLGLYIASQIVDAHGGQIQVSSTEESGTEFLVTIVLQAGCA